MYFGQIYPLVFQINHSRFQPYPPPTFPTSHPLFLNNPSISACAAHLGTSMRLSTRWLTFQGGCSYRKLTCPSPQLPFVYISPPRDLRIPPPLLQFTNFILCTSSTGDHRCCDFKSAHVFLGPEVIVRHVVLSDLWLLQSLCPFFHSGL